MLFWCVVVMPLASASELPTGDEALWKAMAADNHFVLVRHALAPGTGDPEAFTIGRRDTQRNLSVEGRRQAKAMGDLFRRNGISRARVFSSEWYRCQDTAELLELGPVQTLPALNSFFHDFTERDATTAALKQWLAKQTLDQPLVLVTHQVNFTAMTGVYPSSGELVIIKRSDGARLEVVGRIATRN